MDMTLLDFSAREREIFTTLRMLKGCEFVIIGGYAANAYAPARFSVDCDIVVKDEEEASIIREKLVSFGYVKRKERQNGSIGFSRYSKAIGSNFQASIDMIAEEVADRGTGARFSAVWVFENSGITALKGKTIMETLDVRLIRIDALMVMKIVTCRVVDMRDVFMMAGGAKELAWIRKEVNVRADFAERMARISAFASSKGFQDNLSGVYGRIDMNDLSKRMDAINRIARI